jgi:hypothetical protein
MTTLHCHCEERSDFVIFVIASQNAGGVLAWHSLFIFILFILVFNFLNNGDWHAFCSAEGSQ